MHTPDDPLASGLVTATLGAGKDRRKSTKVYAHDDGASTRVCVDVVDVDPRQVRESARASLWMCSILTRGRYTMGGAGDAWERRTKEEARGRVGSDRFMRVERSVGR